MILVLNIDDEKSIKTLSQFATSSNSIESISVIKYLKKQVLKMVSFATRTDWTFLILHLFKDNFSRAHIVLCDCSKI